MFHIPIGDGLKLCLGGAKPTKTPRGDGTASQQFRSYSQTYLTLKSSFLIV